MRQEMDASGSITHWLDGLKAGDSVAAQELWNRYFEQLVVVAQSRLRSLAGPVAGEDVALSALKSVMLGVKANRFPDLTDRAGLWPLLVTITARKSIDEVRRQRAQKRRGTHIPVDEVREVVGSEPSPAFAFEVASELERRLGNLGDDSLRVVALRKLEGYTHEDIAKELNCSIRTVIRKLDRIRQEWDEPEIEDAV
jgi:RNA polymerase sigma factor (sigma-70 family)